MYIGWFSNTFENGMEVSELPHTDIIEALKEDKCDREAHINVLDDHVVDVHLVGLSLRAGACYGMYDVEQGSPEEDEKVIIARDEEHAMRMFWHIIKRN